MKVNEPDSLVCWSERMTVRVSPLATADSVEFGISQATVKGAATASCAAAPPRPTQLLSLKPANNLSFPNTPLPAAMPADCAQSCPSLNAFAGLSRRPPRPPERHPGAPCSHCDARVTVKAKSDLFGVYLYIASRSIL